jgi:hypothetical protein
MTRSAATMIAALVAGVAVLATAAPADAQSRRQTPRPAAPPAAPALPALDLNTPAGVTQAMRRIWCSEVDGQPVYWSWQGDVYARRQGERDRLLFRVQGLNVRTCAAVTDPVRGVGARSVSRELLIYLDPTTGQPLNTWLNPYTNETVQVLHVANDPVNGDFFPVGRNGQPTRWTGHQIGSSWFMTSTVPLFYSNPLAGEYQAEVGGTYHATEMFNFMGETADLVARNPEGARTNVGWVRISDWLPWMKMGGREGVIYMHTAGRKLMNWEEVPEIMRNEVATYYPAYRNPPPVDDTRRNVTSWEYYRAVREGRETVPVRP